MAGALFAGRYYIDFMDTDGNPTGPIGPLNTTQLEIQHQDADEVVRVSNMPGTMGQALDQVSSPQPQQIQISTDEAIDDGSLSPEILARAFAGTIESFTQSLDAAAAFAGPAFAGRAVDSGLLDLVESGVTLYKPLTLTSGKDHGQATAGTGTTLTDSTQDWTVDELAAKQVVIYEGTGAGEVVAIVSNTATAITVAAFGTTPDTTSKYAVVDSAEYVEGVDFTVDKEAGLVVMDAGLSVSGGWVAGTASVPARSGYTIKGAAEPTVTFSLVGYVLNRASKKKGKLTVHQVEAKVSENPDLASGEFINTVLAGTLITPPGKTAPYDFVVETS